MPLPPSLPSFSPSSAIFPKPCCKASECRGPWCPRRRLCTSSQGTSVIKFIIVQVCYTLSSSLQPRARIRLPHFTPTLYGPYPSRPFLPSSFLLPLPPLCRSFYHLLAFSLPSLLSLFHHSLPRTHTLGTSLMLLLLMNSCRRVLRCCCTSFGKSDRPRFEQSQ